MKRRILLTLVIWVPLAAGAQVVNFAKTLPVQSFSVGVAPSYHVDRNVILFDAGGPAVGVNAGYGIQYSVDVNVRYIWFRNGMDYVGMDMQYLLHEARQSYFSVIAGLHRWDQYGFDLTGLYTYSPRYFVSFSVGLDLDADFADELRPRFWVPVNVGFNAGDLLYLYAEYDLPVSEYSWDLFAVGANVVIR